MGYMWRGVGEGQVGGGTVRDVGVRGKTGTGSGGWSEGQNPRRGVSQVCLVVVVGSGYGVVDDRSQLALIFPWHLV
ncbi:hypothetical protein Pmani_024506 [Petrolisthes manimaculis]|uniref:Uncharacterized protein n=1 Tax=Petrolisthes manimaculis TaxID=1843537 RepID=A0AAE1TZA9_9EUCA|nr:hypothetical protein Pmani_024506 [Petrolisthes manimaculis]